MRTLRAWALLVGAVTLAVVGLAPGAAADPVGAGAASAFGASAELAGTGVVPPTPAVSVSAPPFGDDEQTAVPLDLDPLAISGTLTARAAVHQASDLPSLIDQPAAQHALAGPYNARAVSQVEGLTVLSALDETLLDAELIRAEAVAVCRAGTVEYAATAEVVDLVVAGQDPVSGPLNELVDTIAEALEPLAPIVDVDVDVVSVTDDGASVDAIVISLLSILEEPLAEVRIGHAEVSGVACGDAEDVPECADGVDNDGDGLVDEADPECHTDGDPDNPDSYDPGDDDEGPDGETPGCSDGLDNDGDGLVDAADPDCHTDGDPNNPDSYDPDRDETGGQCADARDNDGDGAIDAADPDCHTDGDPNNPDSYDPTRSEGAGGSGGSGGGGSGAGQLPATGAGIATGAAALAALGGLALAALRRRATSPS